MWWRWCQGIRSAQGLLKEYDMPQNDEQAFFVDDELVERLMRGDSPAAKPKTQRPAETSALGNAVKLATAGRLDDAVKELEGAAARGEKPPKSIPAWAICASNNRSGERRPPATPR